MESATKANWLTNAKRFSLESDSIEKKAFVTIKDLELQRIRRELTKNRDEATASISKKITHFRSTVSEIQSKVMSGNWGFHDNQSIQQQLEHVESKLTAFKLMMRADFDAMEENASTLQSEVLLLADNIESWLEVDEDVPRNDATVDPASIKRIEERSQQDLERRATIGGIDRKIAALPKHGGWDPRDHDTFTRIWNQVFDMNSFLATEQSSAELPSQKKAILVRKLLSAFPIMSKEQLEDHIDWYLQYLQLTTAKKKAVSEWREEQVHARRQSNAEVLLNDILDAAEDLSEIKGLVPEQSDTERKVEQLRVAEEERLAAKERIAKWKAERSEQMKKQQTEELRQIAEAKLRSEEEVRRKQAQNRERIEKWKQSEQLQKQITDSSVSKRRSAVDAETLRQRQLRDLERARLRKQRVSEATNKKSSRQETIRAAGAIAAAHAMRHVERDSNRLTAATQASESNRLTQEDLDRAEYQRVSSGAHAAPMAMNARDLQFAGRAIPKWQQRH